MADDPSPDLDLEDARIDRAVILGELSEKIAPDLKAMVRQYRKPAADLIAWGDPPKSAEAAARLKRQAQVLGEDPFADLVDPNR